MKKKKTFRIGQDICFHPTLPDWLIKTRTLVSQAETDIQLQALEIFTQQDRWLILRAASISLDIALLHCTQHYSFCMLLVTRGILWGLIWSYRELMKNIPQMEMIWEENKNTNHWNTIVNINLWTLAYLFLYNSQTWFYPHFRDEKTKWKPSRITCPLQSHS